VILQSKALTTLQTMGYCLAAIARDNNHHKCNTLEGGLGRFLFLSGPAFMMQAMQITLKYHPGISYHNETECELSTGND
jgi:hypothetical protein